MSSLTGMAGLQDSVNEASLHPGISADKVKHLVQNVNLRHAAFQRHAAHSASSSPDPRDGAQFNPHERPPHEQKYALGREGAQSAQQPNVQSKGADMHTSWTHTKSRSRNKEKELFLAASDLCLYLNGGVDYRAMCLRYQKAVDLLILLFREEILMVRQLDVVPCGTINKIYTTLSDFLQETKDILVENNVISPYNDAATTKTSLKSTVSDSHGLPVPLPITCPILATPMDRMASSPNKSTKQGKKRKAAREVAVSDAKESHGMLDLELNPTCHSVNTGNGVKRVVSSAMLERSSEKNSYNMPSCDMETAGPSEGKRTAEQTTRDFIINGNNDAPPEGMEKGTNISSIKPRSQQLEELYNQRYPYEGLEMLTDMMQITFDNEYAECGRSPHEKFTRFKESFEEQVMSFLWSHESFMTYTKGRTTVRSEYVKHCLENNVKPNDKLLSQVGSVLPEREITRISISNTLLDDNDIKPIVAIVPRMQHLRFLNIGYNKIHDDGISRLCGALNQHPTLETLDISGNPISDAGGHDLIHLATSAPQLKTIGQESLCLSKLVQETLNKQLRLNEEKCDSAREAAEQLLGAVVKPRATPTRDAYTTPRLAPIGGGTGKVSHNQTETLFLNSKKEKSVERPNSSKQPYVPLHVELSTAVRLPYLTASRNARLCSSGGNRTRITLSRQSGQSVDSAHSRLHKSTES